MHYKNTWKHEKSDRERIYSEGVGGIFGMLIALHILGAYIRRVYIYTGDIYIYIYIYICRRDYLYTKTRYTERVIPGKITIKYIKDKIYIVICGNCHFPITV